MKKRVFSALVCLFMSACLLSAALAEPEDSGTWGGIDWTLIDGTLTIAPTAGTPVADPNSGKTYEVGAWREAVRYDQNGDGKEEAGWPYDRNAVTRLVIKEGVTSIGSFSGWLPNLTGEVVIPYTVTYIGQDCFNGAPITKLTFAKVPAGKTGQELCIAQGAFKNLRIEEVALPADRPVHLHAWVFGNCPNLKHVTFPASVNRVWGSNHIDYLKDFQAESNATWGNASLIFTGSPSIETITFGSEELRDKFFAQGRNGVTSTKDGKYNGDYIVAYVGLTAYSNLQNALDAAAGNNGTVTLVKSLNKDTENSKLYDFTIKEGETLVIPEGVTLDMNGKTMINNGVVVNLGKINGETDETNQKLILTFNLNGGSIAANGLVNYDGANAAITLNAPVRNGYTFTGWSGTGLIGDANLTVTIPADSVGELAYTANWVKVVLPKTGDSSLMGLWLAMCLASFAGMLVVRRRKERVE